MPVSKVVDLTDPEDQGLAYERDEPVSDLAQLAADVEQEVAEPCTIVHPGDPRYLLTFRSHIGTEEAQSCERRTAKSKNKIRDQNSLLLALTNTGIERNGAPVLNSKGSPVTFRDPELLDAMKATTALDCVVKFMRNNDGHIISIAERVMRDAGFGVEVESGGSFTSD